LRISKRFRKVVQAPQPRDIGYGLNIKN